MGRSSSSSGASFFSCSAATTAASGTTTAGSSGSASPSASAGSGFGISAAMDSSSSGVISSTFSSTVSTGFSSFTPLEGKARAVGASIAYRDSVASGPEDSICTRISFTSTPLQAVTYCLICCCRASTVSGMLTPPATVPRMRISSPPFWFSRRTDCTFSSLWGSRHFCTMLSIALREMDSSPFSVFCMTNLSCLLRWRNRMRMQ